MLNQFLKLIKTWTRRIIALFLKAEREKERERERMERGRKRKKEKEQKLINNR